LLLNHPTFYCSIRLPPISTLFPYTTLFRSIHEQEPARFFPARTNPSDPAGTRRVGSCGRRDQRPARPDREQWTSGGSETDRSDLDRKSTRLNSSHVKISYAVFCLKKKKSNT